MSKERHHASGEYYTDISYSYLSKPTVEGDNWMITQQVASYLIKKMETAVKSPNGKAEDKTDELFKYYLANKEKKRPADVVLNGKIDNAAIVEAFRWRAAELVSKSAPYVRFVSNDLS